MRKLKIKNGDLMNKSNQLPERVRFEYGLLRESYNLRDGNWKIINLHELFQLNTMYRGYGHYNKSTKEVIDIWRKENRFPFNYNMDLLIYKIKKFDSPKVRNLNENYFETVIHIGGYGDSSLIQILSDSQWNSLRDYKKGSWEKLIG